MAPVLHDIEYAKLCQGTRSCTQLVYAAWSAGASLLPELPYRSRLVQAWLVGSQSRSARCADRC